LVHYYQSSNKKLPEIFKPKILKTEKNERVGIVHRIDKDTTGIVVVAKTLACLQDLQTQFQKHQVERSYVALCLATPRSHTPLAKTEHGVIEGIIRRNQKNRKAFELVTKSTTGKFSRTHWTMLQRFSFGYLVRCKLETGRTHQIRVHLQSINNPLAGDTTYASNLHLPKALANACSNFGRQALHAKSLGFVHPVTKKKLFFEAEIPEDMQKLISLFETWKGMS